MRDPPPLSSHTRTHTLTPARDLGRGLDCTSLRWLERAAGTRATSTGASLRSSLGQPLALQTDHLLAPLAKVLAQGRKALPWRDSDGRGVHEGGDAVHWPSTLLPWGMLARR